MRSTRSALLAAKREWENEGEEKRSVLCSLRPSSSTAAPPASGGKKKENPEGKEISTHDFQPDQFHIFGAVVKEGWEKDKIRAPRRFLHEVCRRLRDRKGKFQGKKEGEGKALRCRLDLGEFSVTYVREKKNRGERRDKQPDDARHRRADHSA